MLWWSFAVGVAVGVALTPVTFWIASVWWTRRTRIERPGREEP